MLKDQQVEKLRKTVNEAENELPRLFDALSDASRFRMVQLLLENKGLCVTDISNILGISVPAVSQQFKVLEQAGVVTRERNGQMACYTVVSSNPLLRTLTRLMTEKK